jgi:hypothetical protein
VLCLHVVDAVLSGGALGGGGDEGPDPEAEVEEEGCSGGGKGVSSFVLVLGSGEGKEETGNVQHEDRYGECSFCLQAIPMG